MSALVDKPETAKSVNRGGSPSGKITYHSPLACPACTHSFQGTWTHCTDKEDQICPHDGQIWSEAWAGWVVFPDEITAKRWLARPSQAEA